MSEPYGEGTRRRGVQGVSKDSLDEPVTQSLSMLAKEIKDLATKIGELAQHVKDLSNSVSGLQKNLASFQMALWALTSSVVVAILAVAYKIVIG